MRPWWICRENGPSMNFSNGIHFYVNYISDGRCECTTSGLKQLLSLKVAKVVGKDRLEPLLDHRLVHSL